MKKKIRTRGWRFSTGRDKGYLTINGLEPRESCLVITRRTTIDSSGQTMTEINVERDGETVYAEIMPVETPRVKVDDLSARSVMPEKKGLSPSACDGRCKPEEMEFQRLRRYHDTSMGLWCIDQNPRDVSRAWIIRNAFQLEGINSHGKNVEAFFRNLNHSRSFDHFSSNECHFSDSLYARDCRIADEKQKRYR